MKERLINVFKKVFELENVDETISKENCEKWDSMNHLNLVVEIEFEFNISLEPDEIGKIKNFNTAIAIVLEKS
jgi:acyl carrier protein